VAAAVVPINQSINKRSTMLPIVASSYVVLGSEQAWQEACKNRAVALGGRPEGEEMASETLLGLDPRQRRNVSRRSKGGRSLAC
jgi:hypothetical protein